MTNDKVEPKPATEKEPITRNRPSWKQKYEELMEEYSNALNFEMVKYRCLQTRANMLGDDLKRMREIREGDVRIALHTEQLLRGVIQDTIGTLKERD